jgi:chromosome partition protein MukB
MKRSHALALVLVNWKGVFYERYLLDRHVTALEGVNGAGKTTVMIAAYVVLLPDMSRLRFTNLGETGATGGDRGIWGRLGKPGRPSYAALDFELAGGTRLLAGVHLARKGEPSVEATPFIVTGLDKSVLLRDVMLLTVGGDDSVPELAELRENVARLGGRLQVFSTARDYFAALFDQGVTPLRLGTDEERNKLNEMLRTSMTGGISRALTSELRSFLLKEEGGLADTLQNMRAALDACRRTRTEVQESQRLEHEIGGIFQAGQAMFAAAFLSTRERSDEHKRNVAAAEKELTESTAALREAQDAFTRVMQEVDEAETRRADRTSELEQAKEWLSRVQAALIAAREVAQRRDDLADTENLTNQAAGARANAEQTRDARNHELRKAQENHKLAAEGLADKQRGLDELQRRAHAYRQVVRHRAEAEKCLALSALRVADIEVLLVKCQEKLVELDRMRRELTRQISDAEAHREEHGEALDALRVLGVDTTCGTSPHALALEALHKFRDLRALADQAPHLAQERDTARKHAAQQAKARKRAKELGVHIGAEPAGDIVGSLLKASEAQRAHQQDAHQRAQVELSETERLLSNTRSRQKELIALAPQWSDLDAGARRVGDAVSFPVVDRISLDNARRILSERLDASKRHEDDLSRMQERLLAEARELTVGPFEPDLLRLKDQIGADLLVAAFEDASIENAGRIEAHLGPLAQALVVEDPQTAAREIAHRSANLASVWLVARDADLGNLEIANAGIVPGIADVLVDEGLALRVSRIPEKPRVGRKACERRAAELRAEAEIRSRELERERIHRRALERLVADGEALLAAHGIWLAGNPAIDIATIEARISQLENRIAACREEWARASEAARLLGPRIDGLRMLLSEAWLLDPPDYEMRVMELDERVRAATHAQHDVQRCEKAERVVSDKLDALRRPPLSDSDCASLQQRLTSLDGDRDRLHGAIEAMEYVHEHRDALAWTDAEKQLEEQSALTPILKTQLTKAEKARDKAEQAAKSAEEAYLRTTSSWQDADGRRSAAWHQFTAAEKRFREIGIAEPTLGAETDAQAEVTRLAADVRALSSALSDLNAERGRRETVHQEATKKQREAAEKVPVVRRDAAPALERWERLYELAVDHDLLGAVSVAEKNELAGVRGPIYFAEEAKKYRALLTDRLSSAHGGQELLIEIEKGIDTSEAAFGETNLTKWLLIRDWLRRRLPAQVAEVDDPREALLRLRDQLDNLEKRLAQQENDLRGESENIARGLDVQIRKARGQVQRLNKALDGISFGSIRGIRVKTEPVERMEQVLRALREGATQTLLFQEHLPLEEALNEIFRRYGEGNVRTGGQRLLDYREYVQLQIEIRRHAGSGWEIANPTRVSTGEAIGVGAALMMVVLTEWERDANLLRGKRSSGSLRFLFLDEANRLSHDNLAMLFDLCQALDMQLLIAAPEVAHAEGNTTYHLVRHVTQDGSEEVVVSGRRTRIEA